MSAQESVSVDILRRGVRRAKEKKRVPQFLALHIVDATEVVEAYDAAIQRAADREKAHDALCTALRSVLAGGVASEHDNRLDPEQSEIVDDVRLLVIERDDARITREGGADA